MEPRYRFLLPFYVPFFLLSIAVTSIANPVSDWNRTRPGDEPGFGFVQCTNIVDPSNGVINVPVTSVINWEPAAGNPTAYILMVGTTPGGTQIVNQDVGNVTMFDPPGNLPYGTTIYVTVIGYNALGPATGCMEESFMTVPSPTIGCTQLTSPANGATNVSPSASLTWAAATGNPTGYLLTVGTTPGGTQILNNFNVGNVTTYDPPGNFPANSTIYVKITPYNAGGNAMNCATESFSITVCTPNLVVISNVIPAGTYQSSGQLTSQSSAVVNGSPVVFTSDAGVLLSFDFTVEAGAVFEAKIETCPVN